MCSAAARANIHYLNIRVFCPYIPTTVFTIHLNNIYLGSNCIPPPDDWIMNRIINVSAIVSPVNGDTADFKMKTKSNFQHFL